MPQIVKRSAKRVGRGIGSGKGGHTSGRGTKGQKSRGKVTIQFEGTKNKKSFIKRLPLLRGKGKFKPMGEASAVINLGDFENWPAKSEVTVENLIKNGMIIKNSKLESVKVLAGGEVKQPLTVRVPISKSAAEKVIRAGGKIVED
jgi:large subunit ribosomal protein L15